MTMMTTLQEKAQRGHRAVELHPDLHPQGIDFETAATDIIADVLHAAADAGLVDDDDQAQEILDRAMRTFQGDYEGQSPEPEQDDKGLIWAGTGSLRSRDHIARVEPYQNVALCGVGIAGTTETRPGTPNVCPRCARAARELGVDPARLGIENNLTAEIS